MSDSDAIREAELAGFDLSLIDLNLSLTPDQRLEQHESALQLVLELDQARKIRDEIAD